MLTTTNLRVVWFAKVAENFNVSVPYLQMESVTARESKFGRALLIESTPRSGGFLLGFKVDPAAALDKIMAEIVSQHAAAAERPDFGMRVDAGSAAEREAAAAAAASAPVRASTIAEDTEVVESDETSGRGDATAAYFADGAVAGGDWALADRPVVFSSLLGLAVELPPAGLTLERLWTQ